MSTRRQQYSLWADKNVREWSWNARTPRTYFLLLVITVSHVLYVNYTHECGDTCFCILCPCLCDFIRNSVQCRVPPPRVGLAAAFKNVGTRFTRSSIH